MRLLAALCVVLARRRRTRHFHKSRLLVVNGLDNDAQIDVYFAEREARASGAPGRRQTKPGTMVCVASAVKAGFEFEVHVGEIDDEFVVTLSQNSKARRDLRPD